MYKILEFDEEKGIVRGRKEGIKQGLEKGKAELLLKILNSKFEKIPPKYSKKIYKLSVEQGGSFLL